MAEPRLRTITVDILDAVVMGGRAVEVFSLALEENLVIGHAAPIEHSAEQRVIPSFDQVVPESNAIFAFSLNLTGDVEKLHGRKDVGKMQVVEVAHRTSTEKKP